MGTPKKPFREIPIITGIGVNRATSSSNRASISQLSAGSRLKNLPQPGSSTSWSASIPAASAASTRAASQSPTSRTTSS
jgi:hypothetical protein